MTSAAVDAPPSPSPSSPEKAQKPTPASKDKKPRAKRQHAKMEPLPPLPAGQRVTRPDADAYKAKMDALTKDIDALMAKQAALSQKLPGAGDKGKAEKGPRQELREKIDALKESQTEHQAKRKALQDQVTSLQETIKRKGEDIKSSKDKLSFKSVAEINRRLEEMEAMVSSGTMKLVEEKRMLSDMSSLRKQRKTFDTFAPQESSIDSDKKKIDALRAQIAAMEPDYKRFKAEMDELYAKLKAVDAERAEGHSKLKAIFAERDEVNKKLTVLFDEKRLVHATYKQQQDYWFKQVQEDRAKREEQRRIEQAEYDKQKKLQSIERAREMAELPAFEAEIATCKALISFLNNLTGGAEENGSAAPASNGTASKRVRQVTDNAPVGTELKKKSNEEESLFGSIVESKKKRGNKKDAAAAPAALKFDLEMMSQFLSLNVTLPTKLAEVPAAIEALKKKTQYFVDNQERATKENIAKAKAMEEKLLKSLSATNISADSAADKPAEQPEQAAAPAAVEAA